MYPLLRNSGSKRRKISTFLEPILPRVVLPEWQGFFNIETQLFRTMQRKNHKPVIYILILCMCFLPLQVVLAGSMSSLTSSTSVWSPTTNSSHMQHNGAHMQSEQGNSVQMVANSSNHCDNKPGKCNQCESCSHCLNLLNSCIIRVDHQESLNIISNIVHYQSIDQSSLFRPPIRS